VLKFPGSSQPGIFDLQGRNYLYALADRFKEQPGDEIDLTYSKWLIILLEIGNSQGKSTKQQQG